MTALGVALCFRRHFRRTEPPIDAPVSGHVRLFLSHSGLDAARAVSLQRELERLFDALGYHLTVFNTSTPEARLKELEEVLAAGDDWRERSTQYERDFQGIELEMPSGMTALAHNIVRGVVTHDSPA